MLACALDMPPTRDPRTTVVAAAEAGKAKKTRRQIRREARRKLKAATQARSAAFRGAPPVLPPAQIPAGPMSDPQEGPPAPVRWAGRDPDRQVMPRPLPVVPPPVAVDLPFPKKFEGGLTNAVAEIVLAALRSGCSHKMAANCAMISDITLSQWMHREAEPYLTFQQLVRQAETLPKLFLLDSVMAGARMDSYLALEVLGRREHDAFGKPAPLMQFNQQFNLGDLLERNGTPKLVGPQGTAAPADPRRRMLEGAAT